MKKLFTALLLLVGFVSFSQSIGYFRYDSVRLEKGGGNSELILLNSTRDTIGFLYNTGNGRTRFKSLSSLGISHNVNNGIRKSVDTLQIGDSLTRYTYLQILNHAINNTPFRALRIGNLPEAQSANGVVGNNPLFNTYTPSPFSIERVYKTSNGDIDSMFYGGNVSTLFQLFRDSTDTYFGAGKHNELLAGLGGEFVGQYYAPRDTTVLKVGRDGQSGNVIFGQMDIGNSWGYNLNVVPPTDMPDYPMSLVRSSLDLNRVIDNTRRKKMVGSGWTGYLAMWKTYQTAITGSTYEAGNYDSKLSGFHIYGDAYPLIGAATTKDKILRVWKVDSAFGGIIEPMRRTTNTVYNGYSLWAKGDSDRMHIAGFLSVGGNLPTLDNSLIPSRYRIYNTGRYWGVDSVHGFIVDGYGTSTKIPRSIGNEASHNFAMQDSAVSATLGAFMPDNRDSRYFYIRYEGFNSSYPDNSPGAYIRFETGVNHNNVSRISRNGNWTFGNGVTALTYRWYKKITVDGSSAFLDTVTIKNLISKAGDTTTYKPLVINSNGDVFSGAWNGSGGGGSGTNNANAGSGYRWLKPGTQEIKTLFNAYGITYDSTTNTDGITSKVDSSSGGLQTYLRGIKLVDSMVAVNNSRYWNTSSGNALTSGSQTGSYIGSTNSVPIRFRTNGTQRMYLDSARAQLIIGAPTPNANDALIVQTVGSGNYDGIRVYSSNLAGSRTYSASGIQGGSAYDINTTSGSISITPNSGVIVGTSFGSPTALFQINGSTIGKAQLRLTSTGSLPTGGNILAGNIDAIGDKIYFTTSTGPAQKEFTLNDAALTSGRVPYITTNGRLTDNSLLTFSGTTLSIGAGGGIRLPTAGISANTTLDDTYYLVGVNASGGNITVTLPNPGGSHIGRVYTIFKNEASANTVTIDGNGFNINSAGTKVLTTQWNGVTIVSGGGSWFITSTF